jgi:lipopolysaccharide/colanic/teichoic acid biosynthesis glycosyltransferase
MKRLFDIAFAWGMLLLLSPIFVILACWITIDSGGGVFFGQRRVGRNGVHFTLWKFRTMKPQSEKGGQLTVGSSDSRITRAGYYLRKFKVDELPQLWNVVRGEMSVVGPRPEVPRYVAHYTEEQRKVLSIRPGITDYASLHYFHESDLLAKSQHPEETYLSEVLPAKLQLNLAYLESHSFWGDLHIILLTGLRIFRG